MKKNSALIASVSKLKIAGFFFLFTIILSSNCVKYSFKGALPSYLKTILIPTFEDRSRWVGLQEKVALGVVDAFVRDNTLRVVEDEEDADLVLEGTILPVNTRKTSITPGEVVEEEQLVVSVQVECTNKHTNKALWSGTVSDFGVVSGSATLEERDSAIDEAVDKVVTEILNRTIAAW
jgi:hypothetical protein